METSSCFVQKGPTWPNVLLSFPFQVCVHRFHEEMHNYSRCFCVSPVVSTVPEWVAKWGLFLIAPYLRWTSLFHRELICINAHTINQSIIRSLDNTIIEARLSGNRALQEQIITYDKSMRKLQSGISSSSHLSVYLESQPPLFSFHLLQRVCAAYTDIHVMEQIWNPVSRKQSPFVGGVCSANTFLAVN